MRDVVTTVVEVAGLAAIVVGVGLLSVPAAVIVAGVLAVAISYLVAR
jgi:hypothetical protein